MDNKTLQILIFFFLILIDVHLIGSTTLYYVTNVIKLISIFLHCLSIKMRFTSYIFILFLPFSVLSQHQFKGRVNKELWNEEVYLSLIEDYRKVHGVYPEQIIQKTIPDSLGHFSFTGDQLPQGNHIYKIQTHDCSDEDITSVHFNGFCPKSKEILFVAKHNDSIALPFSFDEEMFCKVVSTNPQSDAFIKVDSLINEMRYAFGHYRSTTSKKINATKWIQKLQEFSIEQKEPLIELYVYQFLSNKANDLHDYYLNDLSTSSFYDELLTKLESDYPNSVYTKQYKNELASDRFALNPEKEKSSYTWSILLGIILFCSILLNTWQFYAFRKSKKTTLASKKETLTSQEQKILQLILEDKTNKEIASSMFVSISTIKTHINNLYKKLEVSSREEVKSLYNK